MTKITFTVPGVPVAWHRAGYNRRTGQIFKNKKDAVWQAKIRAYAIEQRPRILPAGPIMISVSFYMPKPKSHKKCGVYYHIKKPDLDNLVKSVKDAMTGSMYKDDCQIIAEALQKFYCTTPRVVIELTYLDEPLMASGNHF